METVQILRKAGQSFEDFFSLCWVVTYAFQLVLLHFLSPVTGVHVKVLSSASVPLELFRLLTPRSFGNGCYRATGESKAILLWSCQDARHASNVVELSSWILLIVKRAYAVTEKEQGNLLNDEIKLNHNSAGPKQEILITIYTVYM